MGNTSGISYEQIDNLNLLPFWKKNEHLLRDLDSSEMPAKSRLFFKEIVNSNQVSNNNSNNKNDVITNYDLVNIYDNRKNFFSITAELSPDRSSIIREEIIAGNKLSNAKKTAIDGSKITNQAHVDWLKEMSRNNVCQLFRT